jgi:hypothetical protein
MFALSTSTVHSARADDPTSRGTEGAAAAPIVAPMASAPPPPATVDAVARATEALEQATRFRAAGDEAHAKAAEGLAREWAETARDLAQAVAAEKQAEDRKRQAMQAQAQLERTRALVEDGIARLGRLHAELDAPVKSATAVEVHDGQAKPPVVKGRASASLPNAPAGGSTP